MADNARNLAALNELIDKIDTLTSKIDTLITLLGAGLPPTLDTGRLKVTSTL